MEYISVRMHHPAIREAPVFTLPEGFFSRNYRPGDEAEWAGIETSAGEFDSRDEARSHFDNEFAGREDELGERCYFIGCGARTMKDRAIADRPIGTAMGWYGDCDGSGVTGRIHWVGIRPEFQGRGLGRPLVSLAVECLKRFHKTAYLLTQTTSFRGVRIYLDFGFIPVITDEESKKGWRILAGILKYPPLEKYLQNTT
ncbi:MAG: GNAT family N-acetyltransferase [Spirochaetes bacterium]|nr:GNAT family N-acetyltransferase [Spirochaetota bacterium]